MTRDEMIEKLEDVLYALMTPTDARGLISARWLTYDVLAALRAPAVTGESVTVALTRKQLRRLEWSADALCEGEETCPNWPRRTQF